MKIEICIDESAESDFSPDLEQLATTIERNMGVRAKRHYAPARAGEKTLDLQGLTLLLSAIGTLVSIVGLWLETRPDISIDTEINGNKVTIKNPTEADIEAFLTDNIERADSEAVRLIIRQKTARS